MTVGQAHRLMVILTLENPGLLNPLKEKYGAD